jgi:hypothetical protein
MTVKSHEAIKLIAMKSHYYEKTLQWTRTKNQKQKVIMMKMITRQTNK